MEVNLYFSIDEAISIFLLAGLDVKMKDVTMYEKSYHGTENPIQVPIWHVEDPINGNYTPLKELFEQYIEKKKAEIFLMPERMEIYSLFNKKK